MNQTKAACHLGLKREEQGRWAGRILHHAGQVVLRLVLEAEALACWSTICHRYWVLGVATWHDGAVTSSEDA
jgi:hypothetical protein